MFNASNVEFVTKSRTEHMNEDEKAKLNSTKNPIQSILGSSEEKCVSLYLKVIRFYSKNLLF